MLPHILVVDDDSRLRALIRKYLSENGFISASAENADKARETLENLKFDLIVLDVMMPNETGNEFLKTLRKTSEVPVLMLTAQGEPHERIEGLESGADDYMAKPFEPKELVLRIKSILRRQQPKKILFENAGLTPSEQALVDMFIDAPNNTISRVELAEKLGGISERAVDVQVMRLRKKIEQDPKKPKYIQTLRGEGYKLLIS